MEEQSPILTRCDKDTFVLLKDAVDSRDRLCFALTCRRFLYLTLEDGCLKTGMRDIATSPSRFEWAAAFPDSPGWLHDSVMTPRLVARHGSLLVLSHLLEQREGFTYDAECCYEAATHGRLDMLRYLRESLDCPWDSRTCREAARGAHLDLLRWARKHGCEWDSSTCEAAAGSGHLRVLQYAIAEDCSFDARYVLEAAAEGGHLAVLRWAVEVEGLFKACFTPGLSPVLTLF